MKGQIPIDPPVIGEDTNVLWRKVELLVKDRNRQWQVQAPPDASLSATFNGSQEKVILDLSKNAAIVTGCLNGDPASAIAFYWSPPTPIA